MTLNEYISEYMAGVIEKRDAVYDGNDSVFSFDAIDYNEAGNAVKVIYDAEGRIIELDDILHLHISDFKKKYAFRSAAEAFERYLSAYKILAGEEIVLSCKQDIMKAKERLKRFSGIDAMELLGVSV